MPFTMKKNGRIPDSLYRGDKCRHCLSLCLESPGVEAKQRGPQPALLPVEDVAAPPIGPDEPATFLGTPWVQEQGNRVVELMDEDTTVSPIAFVRFSRGGKTRALKEVGRWLKNRGIPCLYISFMGETTYISEETDPTKALTRRIARALCPPQSLGAGEYPDFTPEEVLAHLGRMRCVLLVDELNRLFVPAPEGNERTMFQIAGQFLRANFLDRKGRALVFTTHTASTTGVFKDYVDGAGLSGRRVERVRLPTITADMYEGAREMVKGRFAAADFSHYGLSPALCYSVYTGKCPLDLVSELFSHKNVDSYFGILRDILDVVLTGAQPCATAFLSVAMEVFDVPKTAPSPSMAISSTVLIPAYISPILFKLAKGLESSPGTAVRTVSQFLANIPEVNINDGSSWECIMAAVLGLRCLSAQLSCDAMPSPLLPELPAKFSFEIWRPSYTTLAELKRHLPQSSQVILGFPRYSSFPDFDLLLFVRADDLSPVKVWGYQCKQGRVLPLTEPEGVEQGIVLRGKPAASPTRRGRWVNPSASAVEAFMGPSMWACCPLQWLASHPELAEQKAAEVPPPP